MSLRIGIDLDGTLIDQLAVWRRYYNDNMILHRHAEVYTDTPTWEYPAELCRECFHECIMSPEILRQSELAPGAADALRALVEDGVSLHLVTHRADKLDADVRRLLLRRKVAQYFASVTVSTTVKSYTAKELDLDFLLDDGPHVIEDLRIAGGTIPIIFDQTYNRSIEGLRVYSWQEFAEQMTQPLEVA